MNRYMGVNWSTTTKCVTAYVYRLHATIKLPDKYVHYNAIQKCFIEMCYNSILGSIGALIIIPFDFRHYFWSLSTDIYNNKI